jgi:hypothetical protein
MLLNVNKENLNNVLEWNEIGYLPGADIRYTIYRKIGEKEAFQKLQTTYQSPYIDDQVQSFRGQGKSTRFCYYIKAEINHRDGSQSTLISNTNCVYIKPRIFTPNAIIPNAKNPENKKFIPRFTFVPKRDNYLLIIYDRNGKKVFESNNPEEPWEGRIRGGKKAPGGTYIYYLEVKNPGQQVIRKRGSVTVIYSK